MTKEFLLKCIIEKIERDRVRFSNKLTEITEDGFIGYYSGKEAYCEELVNYLEVLLDFAKDE